MNEAGDRPLPDAPHGTAHRGGDDAEQEDRTEGAAQGGAVKQAASEQAASLSVRNVRGKWEARPRLPNGKRPSVYVGEASGTSRITIARARATYAAMLEQGLVARLVLTHAKVHGTPTKATTVTAIAELWCPLIESSDLAPATRRAHLSNARGPIKDRFGSLEPSAIATGDLRGWLRDLRSRVSGSRTRSIFFTLSKMLDDAVAENWIDTANPCRHPKVREEVPAVEVPEDDEKARHTEAEARQLLGSTKAPERRLRYLVAFTSLFRDGELAGLRFQDLDTEKGIDVYRVRGAVAREGDEGWATRRATKTRAGRRVVPIHPAVLPELVAWRERGWRALVGRDPRPEDPVFANSAGVAWRPRSAHFFREDLEAAGLSTTFEGEPFEFRSTRRSGATWLEANGAPSDIADRIIGHSARSVRQRHYSAADLGVMLRWISTIAIAEPEKLDAPVDASRGSATLAAGNGAASPSVDPGSPRETRPLATLKTASGASLPSASEAETTGVLSHAPEATGPRASTGASLVEALEAALRGATEAKQWDVVAAVVAEIRERRLASDNVVAFDRKRLVR